MRKLLFLILIVSLLGISGMAAAGSVELPNPLCPRGGASGPGCVGDLPALIQKIIDYVLLVIGSLAVLMFVWAGILFVSSAGNPGQITKARQALIYAGIGTAIALAGTGLVAVVREVIGA